MDLVEIELGWAPPVRGGVMVSAFNRLKAFRNRLLCFLDNSGAPRVPTGNHPLGLEPPKKLASPFFTLREIEQPLFPDDQSSADFLFGRMILYVRDEVGEDFRLISQGPLDEIRMAAAAYPRLL